MTKPNRDARKFLQTYSPRKEVVDKDAHQDNSNACLLIVSSTSGFGNAARLAPSIAARLAKSFSKVVVVPTQHKGHANEIMANEPLQDYVVAVIVGGDGAFSEAVNGMLSRTDRATINLAHCPGGSGCAIAGNTLGFWKGSDVLEACDVIALQKTRPMDVTQVECADGKTRYSTSCITGGSGTDTIRMADDYRWTYHIFGPTFRYIIGTIKAYLTYGTTDNGRKMKYTVTTADGKEETFEKATLGLVIYNSGRVAHEAKFAKATPFSGDLTLGISMTYYGLIKQLKYIGALKDSNGEMDTTSDQYKDYAEIHFDQQVVSVKCEPLADSKKPRPIQLAFDGEMGAGNTDFMLGGTFTARILPGKINVIVAEP